MESYEKNESSGRLRKSVSKIAFRGKEKVMRSLGMGEETKDEIIDNYVVLVTKQQTQFLKFQRDVKQYLTSVNAMKTAADAFYQSLNEIYDEAWIGKDVIPSLAKTSGELYSNLHARINTGVMNAVQEHINECNALKAKVQKRGRKLVYFDGARRTYHTLRSAKKIEESKLTKAQETVNQARDTYENLNSQLHQELPDLYDSHVPLCTGVIGTIASAEKECYFQLSEMQNKLLHVLSAVNDTFNRGDYKIQRLHSSFSQSKLSERATLPADDVIKSVPPENYETVSNKSESNGLYDQPADTDSLPTRENERKPIPLPRSDYVNVPIGVPPVSVNGHDDNQPVYEDTEVYDKSRHAVVSEVAPEEKLEKKSYRDSVADLDSASEKSRSLSHLDRPTLTDNKAAHDAEKVVVAETSHVSKDTELRSASGLKTNKPPVVLRRQHGQDHSDPKDSGEMKAKRSSILGLTRLVSTLSRGSKQTQANHEDQLPHRASKSGLFSLKRFKKDKSPADDHHAPTLASVDHYDEPRVPIAFESTNEMEVKARAVFARMNDDSDEEDGTSLSFNDDEDTILHESNDEPNEKIGVRDANAFEAKAAKADDDNGDDLSNKLGAFYPFKESRGEAEGVSSTHEEDRHSSTDSMPVDDDRSIILETSCDDSAAQCEEQYFKSNAIDDERDNSNVLHDTYKVEVSDASSRPLNLTANAESLNTESVSKNLQLSSVKHGDDGDDNDDDDDDDDIISSYHSSRFDTSPSSVSLSDNDDDDDDVDGTLTVGQRKNSLSENKNLSPGLTPASMSSSGSDVDDYRASVSVIGRELPERVDAVQEEKVDGEYPLSDDDVSSSDDDKIKYANDATELHSSAVPQSGENEDGYEDSVYDTILVKSGTTVNDDQPLYEEPASLDLTSDKSQKPSDSPEAQVILPPHFLYVAEAMYPYQGNDEDELSFVKGDIIYVVEYPDPEEQDEGWQMGVLKSSWEDNQSTVGMAVFPANFTRKL